MQCCDEYIPTWTYGAPVIGNILKATNAGIWVNGVFNQWDFVGNMWWNDRPLDGYDSYIPDALQAKIPHRNQDYFIVNDIVMNREQYGNYVKGATAQYAFNYFYTSTAVNALGVADAIKNNILSPDLYNFSIEDNVIDSYYTNLGSIDMFLGKIH